MFKVGDKVVCVKAWHKCEKEGQTYTVAYVSEGAYGVSYIKLSELMKEPLHNFQASRYAHAELSLVPKEADPSGISLNTPGAKADAGKLRPSLVLRDMARAVEGVARVATFGANKYSDGGWLSVPNAVSRYEDALQRHMLRLAQGEKNDPDSGLPHRHHMAWNILAIAELELRADL